MARRRTDYGGTGPKLIDWNPYLRDPTKRRRMIIRAIVAAQAQEGIVCTTERAAEIYDEIHARGGFRSARDEIGKSVKGRRR